MSFEESVYLPDGWRIATVAELVADGVIEKPLDGNHGGIHPKASDYVHHGVPFIMASDLDEGRVNLTTCKFISDVQAKGLRKGFAVAGDVLLSHKATIGRTAIVQPSEHPFIVLTPQVTYYRVVDKKCLNAVYLKAYFDSPIFQTVLAQWSGAGSTRAYLGITGQLKLPIIVPPIGFQNFIAQQARDLGEKIQLNHQINQTLEQIAQAIFKCWFVDFEPVKAKIAALDAGGNEQDALLAAVRAISGRSLEQLERLKAESPEQYAELEATAELFPSAMQESKLGEIPEGWSAGKLRDIACYPNDRVAVEELSLETYVSTENMLENKKGIARASSLPTVATVPSFKINQILVSNIRPYFKKIWFSSFLGGRSPDVICFDSVNTKGSEFLFNVLYQDRFFDYMMRTSKGVKMPRGDKQAIMEFELPVPPDKLAERFSYYVEGCYKLAEAKRVENSNLVSLRDTLLPKLLSGELTIPEAEEQVVERQDVAHV